MLRVIIIFILFSIIFKLQSKELIGVVSKSTKNTVRDTCELTNHLFWWEIEERDSNLYEKNTNDILENGCYSINVNNCVTGDDVVTRFGDVNKLGVIKNGNYYGKWLYIYEKDTLRIENYNDRGFLDGNFIIKNLYKTNFDNGTGYYKDYCFRLNVLKEEGNIVDGKREGKWLIYNENGVLKRVTYFRKGKVVKK